MWTDWRLGDLCSLSLSFCHFIWQFNSRFRPQASGKKWPLFQLSSHCAASVSRCPCHGCGQVMGILSKPTLFFHGNFIYGTNRVLVFCWQFMFSSFHVIPVLVFWRTTEINLLSVDRWSWSELVEHYNPPQSFSWKPGSPTEVCWMSALVAQQLCLDVMMLWSVKLSPCQFSCHRCSGSIYFDSSANF